MKVDGMVCVYIRKKEERLRGGIIIVV